MLPSLITRLTPKPNIRNKLVALSFFFLLIVVGLLRPSKIKMKLFNIFISNAGAERYARISAFTSTLRKQNINVFSSLLDAFNCKELAFAQ